MMNNLTRSYVWSSENSSVTLGLLTTVSKLMDFLVAGVGVRGLPLLDIVFCLPCLFDPGPLSHTSWSIGSTEASDVDVRWVVGVGTLD